MDKDSTNDVALLLRHADRLVKEKNYGEALEAIAQARARDPRNLYALAYEERVRSLVKLKKERENKGGGAADPSLSQAFVPALEHLSELARAEASRIGAQDQPPVEKPGSGKDEERPKRDGDARQHAIEAKITMLLASAESYRGKGQLPRALDEVTRASLLDPDRESVRTLKEAIVQALAEQQRQEELARKRKIEEEEQRRQELLRAELERVRREQEERHSKEEEARRKAQQEKARQYLDRAQALLNAGRLDAALNELAFVLVIDPVNVEAGTMQTAIRDRQEEIRREEEERRRKKEEEERKRRAAIESAIRRHVAEALALAKEARYPEALRTITRAYVIDPANSEVHHCEQQIISMREEALRRTEEQQRKQEEEERQRQEQELHQLEQHERERLASGEQAAEEARRKALREQVEPHLANARRELALHRFDAALAEIALAFLVDPFDDEVRRTEGEILAAQEISRTEQPPLPAPEEEGAPASDLEETVRAYLGEARRLMGEQEYERALEELTRAFILDPLNDEIRQCEEDIEAIRRGGSAPVPAPEPTGESQAPVPADPPKESSLADRVGEHLARAREYLAAKAFDEGLAEIAMGLMLQPRHQDLLELEHELWTRRHQEQTSGAAESAPVPEKDTEKERLFRIHLLAAEEFQKQDDFTRALDEVAKAYVLDPLNPDVRKLETRIRQNQARHKPPTGQSLKLIYSQEQAAGGAR